MHPFDFDHFTVTTIVDRIQVGCTEPTFANVAISKNSKSRTALCTLYAVSYALTSGVMWAYASSVEFANFMYTPIVFRSSFVTSCGIPWRNKESTSSPETRGYVSPCLTLCYAARHNPLPGTIKPAKEFRIIHRGPNSRKEKTCLNYHLLLQMQTLQPIIWNGRPSTIHSEPFRTKPPVQELRLAYWVPWKTTMATTRTRMPTGIESTRNGPSRLFPCMESLPSRQPNEINFVSPRSLDAPRTIQ